MRAHHKPRVPKATMSWPAAAVGLGLPSLVDLYRRGYAGCVYDPEEREALLAALPQPDGERVASDFCLVGLGKGQLTMLWPYAQRKWNVWPKPRQKTGNCVGKAGANIGLLVMSIDAESLAADEETGHLEGYPELSLEGIEQGVVADEPIYGDRGKAGQGASCSRLIRHVTEWGGIVLRKNYQEIGLDLTREDTPLSIKWGRSQTPANVRAVGRAHQIRNATDVAGHEAARDFIAAGHPLWVCSGYGFSAERDEHGYSRRQGAWSHSWVIDGYDDRAETVAHYGFALAHYNHDWGVWNKGPRRVRGMNIDIPEGSMWIDARLLDECDVTAMSSINGWQRRPLPDLNPGFV